MWSCVELRCTWRDFASCVLCEQNLRTNRGQSFDGCNSTCDNVLTNSVAVCRVHCGQARRISRQRRNAKLKHTRIYNLLKAMRARWRHLTTTSATSAMTKSRRTVETKEHIALQPTATSAAVAEMRSINRHTEYNHENHIRLVFRNELVLGGGQRFRVGMGLDGENMCLCGFISMESVLK